MDSPRVSIIIPAWHDESVLQETLKALARVDYPRNEFDVIIVAGGEETVKIAGKFAGKTDLKVQILQQKKEGGKPQAVLDGLEKADGDIIVMLDADTIVEPQWLKELIKPIIEGRLDAVAGNYYPVDETWISMYYTIGKTIAIACSEETLYGGGSTAIPRSVLAGRENYFFEYPVTQDYTLTHRLLDEGFRVGFSEKALVKTYLPASMLDFIGVESRWARYLLLLKKQEVKIFKLRVEYSVLVSLSVFLMLVLDTVSRLLPAMVVSAFIVKTGLRFMKAHKYDSKVVKLRYLPDYLFLSLAFQFIMALYVMKNLLRLEKEDIFTVNPHYTGPRPL